MGLDIGSKPTKRILEYCVACRQRSRVSPIQSIVPLALGVAETISSGNLLLLNRYG
jgi:hypothetical protein